MRQLVSQNAGIEFRNQLERTFALFVRSIAAALPSRVFKSLLDIGICSLFQVVGGRKCVFLQLLAEKTP